MNTIKKIMFMSSNDTSNGMGILKLERKNNSTFCNIKTYNSNISGNYILGMKLNNKIIKQNINLENNSYSFICQEIKELEDLQGCALIKLQDGEFIPILWGNNKDKNYKANIVNSLRQSINNLSNSRIKQPQYEDKKIALAMRELSFFMTPTGFEHPESTSSLRSGRPCAL